MVLLKKDKDIDGLRKSGKILVTILLALKEMTKEGVRLTDLEAKAREMLKDNGASSAFLNYKPEGAKKPYPAALCTSLNDQIVHGVPTNVKLAEGDVLKIDFGVIFEGMITDAAITVGIGRISEEAESLIKTTKEALEAGLEAIKAPGSRIGDIGWAVENMAEKDGFSVVEGLTGHGVGFKLHEDPIVYNYGNKGEGMLLKKGLVLAIEPMLSAGSSQIIQAKDDSYYTKDGSLSAHFEKTIAVTDNGIEILTSF